MTEKKPVVVYGVSGYTGRLVCEYLREYNIPFIAAGLAPDAGAAVASVIEQTPLGRLGEVGDMADAAVFLCSQEARFITGAGLAVDGGMGM